MERFKKIFLILSIILAMVIPTLSVADVGDFESYDSDWGSSWDSSDWGSSSWDSSDWGSSSWDDDTYGGTSSYDDNGIGTVIAIILIIAIVVIASKGGSTSSSNRRLVHVGESSHGYTRSDVRSKAVGAKIRETDKFFNDEKFLSWAKTSFIKLQTAWTERDWEAIRPIESESLFEQHSKQLKGYIDRKQINKMDRISVNYAELVSYNTDNEKDILVVALNSSMNDYIVDEITGCVVKGDKDRRITNTYKLTFIRKKGVLTSEGTDKVNTTNCPNCGAPTTITSSGKCEYCGAVITTGDHDWVLNGMERF